MLLTMKFLGADISLPTALLGGESERAEEFWFGRGLAWAGTFDGASVLYLSLLADVPRLVARTKRRDRDERSAVGFSDPYSWSAAGLMALFFARLKLRALGVARGRIEIDLVAYPERTHSAEIARRLFSSLWDKVESGEGELRLEGERILGEVIAEMPALLLTLDWKARLFLEAEELAEIGKPATRWLRLHPASRAIELALQGRRTPLRLLLPPGAEIGHGREPNVEIEPQEFRLPESISTSLISPIPFAESQRDFAQKAFAKMNMNRNWLIFLPSAISSHQCGDSGSDLERPEGALNYFRLEQLGKAIVEEKHMGSRAIAVLCRTLKVARERFKVDGEYPGCVYTRNGRRFFKDEDTEAVFLERLDRALARGHFWQRFSTDFVCLDGEIMPWAVKAAESSEESGLVEAGALVLAKTGEALSTGSISFEKAEWRATVDSEREALQRYGQMFKKYRTEAAGLSAIRFAPFHLLAVEGHTFFHRSHLWHMETLCHLARKGDGFLIPTRHEVVTMDDRRSWAKTERWWEKMSSDSAEGVVIKPLPFVPRGRRGLAQPALKCRTQDHLRLVYGPRYDSIEAREALMSRGSLLRRRNKHRRILRQFALSMEAVNRFVKRNAMDAVHECVLGVLAQEVAPMELH